MLKDAFYGFREKAVNHFKLMSLRNWTLNQHSQRPLSYYVSQSNSRTYKTTPQKTIKSILKVVLEGFSRIIFGVKVETVKLIGGGGFFASPTPMYPRSG